MVWQRVLLLISVLLFFSTSAQAEEKEPTAIIELGGAGEWGLCCPLHTPAIAGREPASFA
jgi:hypothetical protein